MTDRTFESNDRHIEENLIDPGPIPGIVPTRPQQKELRKALDDSDPGKMRNW